MLLAYTGVILLEEKTITMLPMYAIHLFIDLSYLYCTGRNDK